MDAIVLDNLRLSSQVCRDWRSIIVGSPSLWAQAIDLDNLLPNIFDYTSDYESEPEPENEGEEDGARLWMNEVIRRTGNTPLWIKGQHIGEPKDVHITVELLSWE